MKKIKFLPLLIAGVFLLPIMSVTANAEWVFDPFFGFVWVEEPPQSEVIFGEIREEILIDEEIVFLDDYCNEWEKYGCKCGNSDELPETTETTPKPAQTEPPPKTEIPHVTATSSPPAATPIIAPAPASPPKSRTTTKTIVPPIEIPKPDIDIEEESEPEQKQETPEANPTDILPDDWVVPDLDGIGTIVEYAMGDEGKIFYTISTAEGNVFYIVVDQNRNNKNVYLLHTVSNFDLAMLTEGGGVVTESAVPEVVIPEPEPEIEVVPEPPAKKKNNNGATLFILIAAAVIGAVGYYFKVIKPKKDTTDGDYDDDFDENDFYGEGDYNDSDEAD